MDTNKRRARYAGLLYLLLAVIAPIGIVVVPGRLMVVGDAAATASNIAANDWLLRVGIAGELVNQVIQVFLVLALYNLFEPVSKALARQLVILGALVSVPVVFVNVLFEVAALLCLNGALSPAFAQPQLAALAYLFLTLHAQGIIVVEVFWGLWLLPFALLVIRSGFIPKIFGYLLAIAGLAYLVGSFGMLLLPTRAAQIGSVVSLLVIAEVPIVFWLLIWGAREPAAAPAPSA